MKRKHKRLTFVAIALLLLGAATALVLSAFEDSIVFFQSPTDLAEKKVADGKRVRLGGLVEEGSVKKTGDAITLFRVTDLKNTVTVSYKGLLPDLFREGQGVVAEGRLKAGVFNADEVLAKHDETYMPPEVADALKKSGQWQGQDKETNKKSEKLY
ncbi:MAG TPA: cytochrome c maturation protein CcmE [Rhodospirillales bacterium]|jgi:cytochrome c-type biogenesis protein CcmE|nr:cytochrome c maturation protein CcmE [Rhodospirillales bacterium]|tara:strand:+ start:101 stop:568 length:468 start_codon:yes stop_codon:yes gene_type:complete